MSNKDRKLLEKLLLAGIIWEYMMDNPGEVSLYCGKNGKWVTLKFIFNKYNP